MKKCSKCEIEKELTEFHKRTDCKDGFRADCKVCYREYKRGYKSKNREKVNEYAREYYSENYEKIQENRENNKDNICLTKQKYYVRKSNDPLFKLSCSIRSLLTTSIKRMGYTKNNKTEIILGISFNEFKLYIEKQFIEGMSWDNHGEWHLDHKIPLSWAKTKEEVYDLNKYTNFQPLWQFDNLSKGNRYSH